MDNEYYKTKNSVKLIKAAPVYAPLITTYVSNNIDSKIRFSNRLFKFACRYHYADGEVSALSPYSRVAFQSTANNVATETPSAISLYDMGNGNLKINIYNIKTSQTKTTTIPLAHNKAVEKLAFNYVKISDTLYRAYYIAYGDGRYEQKMFNIDVDANITYLYEYYGLLDNPNYVDIYINQVILMMLI